MLGALGLWAGKDHYRVTPADVKQDTIYQSIIRYITAFKSWNSSCGIFTLLLECDLVPADFVFLLDSSGSETSRGFKTQLAFISNFTSNFEVGPDKAQFAAVTFSTSVYKNFYLNEHQDQASVLDAINKIAYRDGETYTDLGLNYVRQNVLTGRCKLQS